MAKGLNKAERHAIRRYVRECSFVTTLEMLKAPVWFRRLVMAEVRKRRWHFSVNLDEWQNPRWRL